MSFRLSQVHPEASFITGRVLARAAVGALMGLVVVSNGQAQSNETKRAPAQPVWHQLEWTAAPKAKGLQLTIQVPAQWRASEFPGDNIVAFMSPPRSGSRLGEGCFLVVEALSAEALETLRTKVSGAESIDYPRSDPPPTILLSMSDLKLNDQPARMNMYRRVVALGSNRRVAYGMIWMSIASERFVNLVCEVVDLQRPAGDPTSQFDSREKLAIETAKAMSLLDQARQERFWRMASSLVWE